MAVTGGELLPRRPRAPLVVVPRTPALDSREQNLRLGLVANVAGTRPPISTDMLRAHLRDHFGLMDDEFSVRRHFPEDFLVRFVHGADRERVLESRRPSPLPLVWYQWRRTSLGHHSSFKFRVLLALSRVPLHARSVEVAQAVLSPACAQVEETELRDIDDDDDREYFVTAWCKHPAFIADRNLIFIPEPNAIGIALPADALPGLSYLVRVRLVAFQDYSTPPGSPQSPPPEDLQLAVADIPHGDLGPGPGGAAAGDGEVEDGPCPPGGVVHHREQRVCLLPLHLSSVKVGDVQCPLGRPWILPGARQQLSLQAAVTIDRGALPVSPTPASQMTTTTVTGSPPPSAMLRRRTPPPGPGIVGSFINTAPFLLQDGRCTRPCTPKVHDWFADCVDTELSFRVMGPAPPHLACDQPRLCEAPCAPAAGPVAVCAPGSADKVPARENDEPDAGEQADLAFLQPMGGAQQVPSLATSPAPVPCAADMLCSGAVDCDPTADQLSKPSSEDFFSSLVLPLEPPLLDHQPALRSSRLVDENWRPRRSDRLADKSAFWDPNPEKQARRVMVRKWSGREARNSPATPDQAVSSKFHEAFGADLPSSRRAAIRELFPALRGRSMGPLGRHGRVVTSPASFANV